ncbi:MAG: DNA polymerase III subunit gamma/tau [Deltaproteobacteria bacterium]|nr:DNA polymerase III subunit gamma/tau [Deltaproteobacteria bacterium]
MSSRVLALKYRPQTFEDVVGQEVTVKILKNILTEGRIHHAYLFTGPRGIGKTSLARILAKALNCQKTDQPTTEPCGSCPSCVDITEGRSMAVMEIDGASNTSVEDVREIREKIRYLAPGGRYKIYIIDEVHMLSTAAFNALLKTLEEPPPHALFIFATTEPQKVPITIISRCLRFDLRPMTLNLIVGHLKRISEKESIEVEEAALFEIAREASGGLRDAITLLDQVASYFKNQVKVQGIEEILGASPRRFVISILRSILNREAAELLQGLKAASEAGIDPKRLARELLEYLRHLLIVRIHEDPALFDLPSDEIKKLKELSQSVSENLLDQLFRMLQKGLSDLLRSATPQIVLDVLLLRLCHHEDLQSIEKLIQMIEGKGAADFDSDAAGGSGRAPARAQRVSTGGRNPSQDPPISNEKASSSDPKDWQGFLGELQSKKPQIASILAQALSSDFSKDQVMIKFPEKSLSMEMLNEAARKAQLLEQLEQYFGRPLKLVIEAAAPSEVITTGGVIEEAISIFQPSSLTTIRSS